MDEGTKGVIKGEKRKFKTNRLVFLVDNKFDRKGLGTIGAEVIPCPTTTGTKTWEKKIKKKAHLWKY